MPDNNDETCEGAEVVPSLPGDGVVGVAEDGGVDFAEAGGEGHGEVGKGEG